MPQGVPGSRFGRAKADEGATTNPRGAGTKAKRSGAAPARRNGWPAFRPDQIEKIRATIDTVRIIKRLQDHTFNLIQMSDSQIKAAAILLRKTIPDLTAVDITANGGGPLVIEIVKFAPDASPGPTIIEHEPAEVPQVTDGKVH